MTAKRILVIGGGVGGLTVTRRLEHLFARRGAAELEIVLVSRENYFLLSPLLFEACSGVLELRHCAQPIRPCLRRARFIEAAIDAVDVERRVVHAVASDGREHELSYDQLVVALGATTNERLIAGSEHALRFKTIADALLLRNHLIERFERADSESDEVTRRELLTVAVIGGGQVGVELAGELAAFADNVISYYPRVRRSEIHLHLFEVGDRLLPEATARLSAYAATVLESAGVQLHLASPVARIEPGLVQLRDESLAADTIVLVAGIVPSAAVERIGVQRDTRGRIAVDAAMRSLSHPNVWALGDCASIPDPDGKPYPALAQHAVREARTLADNILASDEGRATKPFVFQALGTMASFGHTRAAATVLGVQLTGFVAWWVRRTYYLFQMPRWDRRLRMVLDWTVAMLFRPDITRVDFGIEPVTLSQLGARTAELPAMVSAARRQVLPGSSAGERPVDTRR